MKRLKRIGSFLFGLTLTLGLCVPAFAAVGDTGYSDVSADAWYAEAVDYCRENGFMSGTGADSFSPEENMTRSMLVTVLYRQADTPAVTGAPTFTDTAAGTWYSDAVVWATADGLMQGYGNGLFGTNDPVTREQLATVLYRQAGSPQVEAGEAFADESAIASYALNAVRWARANGIINGSTGNRFLPKDNATRAQVAQIMMNSAKAKQPDPTPAPAENAKVLVAYFSATNNTEGVAEKIVDVLGSDKADLFEIVPAVPYTSADLNYNSDCRANREQNDASARPEIASTVANMEDYDVVFVGYPIWWGQAPKIMYTFMESYDFNGKTIVPFCTSGSSGIGSSATNLAKVTSGATWLSGNRFSSGVSQSSVQSWVDGLDLSE